MTYTTSHDRISLESVKTPLHEALLGHGPAIMEVQELVRRLAPTNLTVLITGESGTGKDIVARLLHKLSPRYGKAFIKVNCPAIPEGILESELFGYERGAFTGARTAKPGRFELANHGTIFLDEIAETSYNVQGKLLQVLDGEPFMRIGGVSPIQTDVRIITATNVELEEAVQKGRIREDIYYRLSEVHIRMPALRERPEDVHLLAEHFNYHFSAKQGKEHRPLTGSLVAQLREQAWPGNVRELAARVKKYVTTGNPETLLQDTDGPEESAGTGAVAVASSLENTGAPRRAGRSRRSEDVDKRRFVPLKEATRRAVEATERALIEEALRYTLWNRRRAARLLEISYSSLLRRIETYNLDNTESET